MMLDQAASLRERMLNMQSKFPASNKVSRVISVASGKGGVGKSNFCVNFALSLQKAGFKPIVVDTDIGFANIEVLLDVHPIQNMFDLLHGAQIWDIVQTSPSGLPFLSAGSGLMDIHNLSDQDMEIIIGQMKRLSERFDVILLDSGAGMGIQLGHLVGASDELIMLTTPEPTAITDAYALMKMLRMKGQLPPVRLVVNRAPRVVDAKQTAEKLRLAASRFLELEMDVLGYILEDEAVVRAVMNQRPLLLDAPHSKASRCVTQIVENYLRFGQVQRSGLVGFLEKLFLRRSG